MPGWAKFGDPCIKIQDPKAELLPGLISEKVVRPQQKEGSLAAWCTAGSYIFRGAVDCGRFGENIKYKQPFGEKEKRKKNCPHGRQGGREGGGGWPGGTEHTITIFKLK